MMPGWQLVRIPAIPPVSDGRPLAGHEEPNIDRSRANRRDIAEYERPPQISNIDLGHEAPDDVPVVSDAAQVVVKQVATQSIQGPGARQLPGRRRVLSPEKI
jgi:hypothetical protein